MAIHTINYTVTVDDDPTIQQAFKDLLDQQLDVAGAGGQYLARGKKAFTEYGTIGMKQKLRGFRGNEAVTTMRATQDAINSATDVGDGVDV